MSRARTPTREAVLDRLDDVYDPELDESIVALEYVDEVDREGGEVTVRFTLPTAWCSPAFAWMMATDARREVESLPGVRRARVYVRDHMHAGELNRGVNAGATFEATFPDAEGGVEEVRRTLDEKARLSRQYEAVETLLDAGVDGEQACHLTLDDVVRGVGEDVAGLRVAGGALVVTVPAEPLESYLAKARETGLVSDPDDRLFRTPEGDPIPPERFDRVHKRGRLARVNMSGQGGVCDALNRSRRDFLDRDEACD